MSALAWHLRVGSSWAGEPSQPRGMNGRYSTIRARPVPNCQPPSYDARHGVSSARHDPEPTPAPYRPWPPDAPRGQHAMLPARHSRIAHLGAVMHGTAGAGGGAEGGARGGERAEGGGGPRPAAEPAWL